MFKLFGAKLAALIFFAAGCFPGLTLRHGLKGDLYGFIRDNPGLFLGLFSLHAVALYVLARLRREMKNMAPMTVRSLAKLPWYEKLSGPPINARVCYWVWTLAYITGCALSFLMDDYGRFAW